MKFRFLGDGDCPDWLLAEINTLSRMTSIKMKVLGQVVAKCLTEGTVDEDKIKKLIHDAKMDTNDAKAIVAALELIFSSSARHAVSAPNLSRELQQLGLPHEHSTALSRLYAEHCPQLTTVLFSKSLRLKRLASIETLKNEIGSPFTKIIIKTMGLNNKEEIINIIIPSDELPVLLSELKRAKSLMNGL